MSPFGELLFSQLGDMSRRIADGVPTEEAAATFEVECRAWVDERALSLVTDEGGKG